MFAALLGCFSCGAGPSPSKAAKAGAQEDEAAVPCGDFRVRAVREPPPPPAAEPAASASPPGTPSGQFLYDPSSSEIVGIKNTSDKYGVNQPVRIHTTPIEERIERMLRQEERALARRALGAAP